MTENSCSKSLFLPRLGEDDTSSKSKYILVRIKKEYKVAIRNIKSLEEGINCMKSNHNNAKYLDDTNISTFDYTIKNNTKYSIGDTFILGDPTTETFKVYDIICYPGYIYGEYRYKRLIGEYEIIIDQSDQKQPLF